MVYFNSEKNLLQKTEKIAKQAAGLFIDDTRLTVELLAHSQNYIYLVKGSQTKLKRILRVSRPDYNTKSQIESEIAWLKAVGEQTSVIVPTPIKGTNGEYVQSVTLKNDLRVFHCTMFDFLEGDVLDKHHEDQLTTQFERVGELTALLHNHSQKWEGACALDRDTWNYETILGKNPKWGKWQDGVAMTPERIKLLKDVSAKIQYRLDQFGKGPNRFGLIHADLRLTNLLAAGDQIKVIDFDDCGFSWYMFDIGAALSFIEHKSYVPELAKAWLKGYRKFGTISKAETDEIPTFIMMRRLMLIAWIGSHDNPTTQAMGGKYTQDTDQLAKKYLANSFWD